MKYKTSDGTVYSREDLLKAVGQRLSNILEENSIIGPHVRCITLASYNTDIYIPCLDKNHQRKILACLRFGDTMKERAVRWVKLNRLYIYWATAVLLTLVAIDHFFFDGRGRKKFIDRLKGN